ncbi:protein mono-ADP-ribosyltransferase PARP4 isoform X2 [Labrus mixtus]|uniref:protein mono-ADP-ribosyltransferase PARP4 isoform X2 n=1 Tax=Labrus mixtus TaxID=508554 RepID=UPI0029C03917|nr:protein mono-ADP-ribosyltransferase PARP4 isoform X2 [Labrus mixtus]
MAVFENCSVLLDLKNLPFKEKKKLKEALTDNGGNLSFVVNKQCSLIVASDVSNLSTNRLRNIQKYQTPVVGLDYVYSCVERGVLLPVDEYKLDTSPPLASSPPVLLSSAGKSSLSKVPKGPLSKAPAEPYKGPSKPVESIRLTQKAETLEGSRKVLGKFRNYTETDSDLPTFPDNFQVAKYSIFEKVNSNTWCVLELQSFKGDKGWQYRVVRYRKDDILSKKAAVMDMQVFLSTSEEALEVYKDLRENLQKTGLQLRSNFLPQVQTLGSDPLQQLLLEEKLHTGSLSKEVGGFVELLWTEALGCLRNILRVSIDKLSLNDVSRVEGLLLQAQRKLKEKNENEVASLMEEVYTLLPHKEPPLPPTAKLISQKLDLCQVIRDVLNVSEMTLSSPMSSSLGKYRALRCSIETVSPGSSEFQAVTAPLQGSKVQIHQVFRVSRGVELQMFKSELGNIKPLLHSSSPSNFVGVLSRGLLLPRVGVEHHGIERTDIGNLGSGIYFSDVMSTSLKYSKPSATDGSRLLLVSDVALGKCQDFYKRDHTMTEAPEGHDSVRGVRCTRSNRSEFQDDEYVVYSPDQVKLKYVVQFSIEGDQLKEFSPVVNTSAELLMSSTKQELGSEFEGVESVKNPLEDVTAGLLDSSGQQLPLQAVHVKCKLMDLLSQVIIFQKYTNLSSVPIEAKYVFPLDDSAAVCGFEAFINGKHVIGKVKEKEKARKEYKQAIEKGHGAYLMDQDAPDVFTISVGNLPPGATVLIKVTFVSELIIKDGSILFSLPGSVAPWQESAALNQTTQVTVEKVCVTDDAANKREFTLDMSIEMPNEIKKLTCLTHQVKIKRTDCKAVVSVLPDEVMSPEGFHLLVTLSEVHLPRMWVEKHPDKDSQACMLVFYPDFDVDSCSESDEVVLLIDTSESMKGESLRMAQKIALQALKHLDNKLRLNVILFGTDHSEIFLTPQPLVKARPEARSFIKCFSPVGGSTELWRPLRALSLLPPSRGVRNLLLLSDGHIQNAEVTLRLLRENAQHSRLFTCGLSPTANRHMLRALAQAGGGAFEFFDTKTKHNWAEKVARQLKRMASPGCSSVSVKWQQFNPTATSPVQAPKQLQALFNDSHTLVYGFVRHCTQATLLGNISGQELKTMVSTTELQKTKGTFLHKLAARAVIRDFEDGSLDTNEAEHEGKKAVLKDFVIEMSKEFSILSQFTSFVAIEERDSKQGEEGVTDIPKLIAEEDVDFLPYVSWISPPGSVEKLGEECSEEELYSGAIADSSFWSEKMSCGVDLFSSFEEDEEEEEEDEEEEGEEEEEEEDDGLSIHEMMTECLMEATVSPEYEPTSPGLKMAKWTSVEDSAEEMEVGGWRRKKVFAKASSAVSSFAPKECLDSLSMNDIYSMSAEDCSMLVPPPRHPSYLSGIQAKTYGLPPPPPPPPAPVSASGFGASFFGQPPLPPPSGFGAYIPCSAASQRLSLGLQADSLVPLPTPSSTGLPTQLFGGPLCGIGQMAQSFVGSPPPPPSTLHQGFSFGGLQSNLRGFSSIPFQARAFGQGPPPLPPSTLLKYKSFGGPLPPPPPPSTRPQVKECGRPASAKPPIRDLSGMEMISYCDDMERSLPEERAKTSSSTGIRGAVIPGRKTLRSGRRSFRQKISCGFDEAPRETSSLSFSLHQMESQDHQVQVKDSTPGPVDELRFACAQELQSRRSTKGRRKEEEPTSTSSFSYQSDVAPEEEQPIPEIIPQSELYRSSSRSRLMMIRQFSVITSAMKEADDLRALKLRLTKIFQLQHSEGYWEITSELGELVNVDVDQFANVFLKNKGINSLGVKARVDILRLVMTLLVLQLMRVEKLEEGKLLRTLFSLDDSSQPRPERWEEVKKAVDWVRWADRQYPCVYSRLEFGLSWESSTRQLLGYEALPPFSALSGLNLQKTAVPLLVQ